MKAFIVKYAGLLSLAWILIIFLLCAAPGEYVPAASWLELLSFDKWVHAGIFFILVFLLIVFAVKMKMKLYGATVFTFLSIIYGGVLEIMQAAVFSSRSSDWRDFIANTAGCMLAWCFYRKIKKAYIRFKALKNEPASETQ